MILMACASTYHHAHYDHAHLDTGSRMSQPFRATNGMVRVAVYRCSTSKYYFRAGMGRRRRASMGFDDNRGWNQTRTVVLVNAVSRIQDNLHRH